MRAPSSPGARAYLALVVTLGVLAACGENDAPDDEPHPVRPPEIAEIMPASEALDGAHIPTLDPIMMDDAELLKGLGGGPRCEFRYTSTSKPVFGVRASSNGAAADGVVKLNGHLVALRSESSDGTLVLVADNIRMTLKPVREGQAVERGETRQKEADLIFEVDSRLRVGYRGYYKCVD